MSQLQSGIFEVTYAASGKIEMIDPKRVGDHFWRATIFDKKNEKCGYAVGDMIEITLEALDEYVPQWKVFSSSQSKERIEKMFHVRDTNLGSFNIVSSDGHIAVVSGTYFDIKDNQLLKSFSHKKI